MISPRKIPRLTNNSKMEVSYNREQVMNDSINFDTLLHLKVE